MLPPTPVFCAECLRKGDTRPALRVISTPAGDLCPWHAITFAGDAVRNGAEVLTWPTPRPLNVKVLRLKRR